MTIESNGYVATVSDIKELMRSRLTASDVLGSTGQTYLRALIATAQKRLGVVYRASRGRVAMIDNTTHLDALRSVHTEFYDAICSLVDVDKSDAKAGDRAVRDRTGFARSAYSTVRNWLLLGKRNLSQLDPTAITKHGLASNTPTRDKPSTMVRRRFKRASIVKRTQDLLGSILAASTHNREEAIGALHDAITALSRGFDDLGLDAQQLREEIEHTTTQVIPPIPQRRRKAA